MSTVNIFMVDAVGAESPRPGRDATQPRPYDLNFNLKPDADEVADDEGEGRYTKA